MRTKIIVACDAGGGIGYNNRIPWPRCRDDLVRFKKVTIGTSHASFGSINAVVMGYNTWVSLPQNARPLPNRLNIILTNTHYDEIKNNYSDNSNIKPARSWDDLENIINSIDNINDVWVIGGQSIYEQSFEQSEVVEIHITQFNFYMEHDKTFAVPYEELAKFKLSSDSAFSYAHGSGSFQVWKRVE